MVYPLFSLLFDKPRESASRRSRSRRSPAHPRIREKIGIIPKSAKVQSDIAEVFEAPRRTDAQPKHPVFFRDFWRAASRDPLLRARSRKHLHLHRQIFWLVLSDDQTRRRGLTSTADVTLFGTFHHLLLWPASRHAGELHMQVGLEVRRRRETSPRYEVWDRSSGAVGVAASSQSYASVQYSHSAGVEAGAAAVVRSWARRTRPV